MENILKDCSIFHAIFAWEFDVLPDDVTTLSLHLILGIIFTRINKHFKGEPLEVLITLFPVRRRHVSYVHRKASLLNNKCSELLKFKSAGDK